LIALLNFIENSLDNFARRRRVGLPLDVHSLDCPNRSAVSPVRQNEGHHADSQSRISGSEPARSLPVNFIMLQRTTSTGVRLADYLGDGQRFVGVLVMDTNYSDE